jgi:ribonuclease D
MAFHWNVLPNNVACTKIASKLLDPVEIDHSLQRILQKHLNVWIDKESRVSNWLNDHLSKEQLEYAASDVIYLPRLFAHLKERLESCNRWDLATGTFNFLPARVQLDLMGAGDVFSY